MNKNIKKIIAFAIICTAFSAWIPSPINIWTQCAYAYSKYEITTLGITSGVSVVPIYSSVTHDADYRIKKGEKIPIVVYSKIPSNKTTIKLNTIETKAADIRGFVGEEKLKLDDIYGEINIAEGESKSIYIRLYDSKNASDSNYTLEYELVAEREVNDDDNIIGTESEDDTITLKDYDDIYLNRLTLSDTNNNKIDLAFDKIKPIYDISVDESMSYINVKAVPEQTSYKLLVDNKDVDPKDDGKDTRLVPLDKGKNIIKIRIISSDNKYREYYLNVTRGKSTSATTSINTTDNQNPQGVQPIGWLYRKADGTMATGWISIGNEWYYFDLSGTMKTGWLQDTSGKWYYLKESGMMAKNTTINGYKIGADGVYIIK